ncbi:tetratricopeptide repeat protein [Metallibacterium scheffleri]
MALPLICALLSACASTAPRMGMPDAAPVVPPAQPLARLPAPATPQAAVMADVMHGDFALAHNDLSVAARAYLRAAQAADNPDLAERALDLAIAVRDVPLARQALARWQALGAPVAGVRQARASLALAAGDRADAMVAFTQLTGQGAAGWREALRALAGARDPVLAGAVLEHIATPQRLAGQDDALWLACSELGARLGRRHFARTLAAASVRHDGSAAAYLWQAQLRQADGDRAGAEASLQAGLRRHPRNIPLRLVRAARLAEAGASPAALGLLDNGPQNHDTYALRAAIAARARQQPALRALYAELARLPAARRGDEAYLLGQLAELLGQPRAALRWYAAVPVGAEHGFAAAIRRAVLLDRTGQAVAARTLADTLARESFEDPRHYRQASVLQAELAQRARDWPRAIAAYSRALLFDPDAWDLVYARGVSYAEAGRTADALRDFHRVLAAQPDNVDAMNALGFTLVDADRDLPEAGVLLARALAARPDDAAINDSWGWLQYRLGDYPAAVTALRKAWRLQASAEIGAHLAHALLASGARAQARQILDAAWRIDPHSRSVQALRGQIGS